MKKKYVTPEMEMIDVELATIIAASDEDVSEGGSEFNPQAPGMMSFDDIDTDYMEEDDY